MVEACSAGGADDPAETVSCRGSLVTATLTEDTDTNGEPVDNPPVMKYQRCILPYVDREPGRAGTNLEKRLA
jgi:hypothetical protein